MKKTKYYCDFCDGEAKEGIYLKTPDGLCGTLSLNFRGINTKGTLQEAILSREDLNICPKCLLDKLKELI